MKFPSKPQSSNDQIPFDARGRPDEAPKHPISAAQQAQLDFEREPTRLHYPVGLLMRFPAMSAVGRFPAFGFLLVNLRVVWSVIRVLPAIRKSHTARQASGSILVSDREGLARDNGEAFFKFLMKTSHRERAYFVISRESTCGKRLSAEGLGERLIEPMSLQYWRMATQAKAIVSSQRHVDVHVRILRALVGRPIEAQSVFLRHGITSTSQGDVDKLHSYDILCCSIGFDRRDLLKLYERHGKSVESLRLLGMPRFDRYEELKPKRTNRIIVSPTWRSGKLSPTTTRQNQLRKYIRSWTELLSRLSESDLDCMLISHPLLHREITSHAKKMGIKVHGYEGLDFQFELASASVFVTDFSSSGLEALFAETSLVLLRPPDDRSFSDFHLGAGLEYDLMRELGAHICLSLDCAERDTLRKAQSLQLERDELVLRSEIFASYPPKANQSILGAIFDRA
jgi:hypothetical protein